MMRSGSTGYMAPLSPNSPKADSRQSYPLPKPPAGSKPPSTSYKLPKPPAGSKPGKVFKKGGKRDLSAEEAAWEDAE